MHLTGIKRGAQIESQEWCQDFRAAIHYLPERRFAPVEFRTHIHVLGSLSREEKRDRRLRGRGACDQPGALTTFQNLHCFGRISAHQHPAMRKCTAASLQGVGHLRQVHHVFLDVPGQVLSRNL